MREGMDADFCVLNVKPSICRYLKKSLVWKAHIALTRCEVTISPDQRKMVIMMEFQLCLCTSYHTCIVCVCVYI